MTKILVSPEQLTEVANQFKKASEASQQMHSLLSREIVKLESLWQGMNQKRFYSTFQESRSRMDEFSKMLTLIENDLHNIAKKFTKADQASSKIEQRMSNKATPSSQKAPPSHWEKKDNWYALDPKAYENSFGKGSYAKIFGGEYDTKIPLNWQSAKRDLLMGQKIGGEAKFSIIDVGDKKGLFQWDLSKGTAGATMKYEDYTISAGAEASIVKYEGAFHIPLPFTEYDFKIGGEAAIGSYGAKASAGLEETGFFYGFGPGGLGLNVGFSKDD